MKRFLNFLLLAFIFGAIGSCQKSEFNAEIIDEPVLKSALTGQPSYIVTFTDEFLSEELNFSPGYEGRQRAMQVAAEQALRSAGILIAEIEFVYSTAIKGFSVKMPQGQVQKLEQNSSVKHIEKDQKVSLVEPHGRVIREAEAGTTSLQSTPWGIVRVKGGINYGGNNSAWVIDTGIDLMHPDLNVDSQRSVTFISNTTPNDENGHGTHVAGTIAAINNDFGVVGVAAGAPVVSVRVLDNRGNGTLAGVIAGVDYVAAHAKAGDVANMSLVGGASDALDNAVLAASKICVFVLSAGNNGLSATNYSPARVNGPNIYTISAMSTGDVWASYSNFGNPPVDYCAPGTTIYSAFKDGGYATLSGTSMAAPHVAGILLLGNLKTDGVVTGDPDPYPDPIAIFGGMPTLPEDPPPGEVEPIVISLTVTSMKDRGLRTATLAWTGGTAGAVVTIYRNGLVIGSAINNAAGKGTFFDDLQRLGGKVTYQVCESSCSNSVTIN